jgi:hypothetical protein
MLEEEIKKLITEISIITIEYELYVSKTGKRYHKSICLYLKITKILIDKKKIEDYGLTHV